MDGQLDRWVLSMYWLALAFADLFVCNGSAIDDN